MQQFTANRTSTTVDEIWLLEHEPVFTQGQAGKAEHILTPGNIPVIQTDRGGQVTYHGPGQLIAYFLMDLKRRNLSIRGLITTIENAVIQVLKDYDIVAHARPDAPGVYIEDAKIASLGLRIRRGYSYHGLSFNIHMDLAPFQLINPCGMVNLRMTQLQTFYPTATITTVCSQLILAITQQLQINTAQALHTKIPL